MTARVEARKLHALALRYRDGKGIPEIAKELKVTQATVKNYIAEGLDLAAKHVNAQVVNDVRDELMELHRSCIRALQEEINAGGPGNRGVAGTCKAIKGHADSMQSLTGATARPSVHALIGSLDTPEDRASAKIRLGEMALYGDVTASQAATVLAIIDSIDGGKKDPYSGMGEKIVEKLGGSSE